MRRECPRCESELYEDNLTYIIDGDEVCEFCAYDYYRDWCDAHKDTLIDEFKEERAPEINAEIEEAVKEVVEEYVSDHIRDWMDERFSEWLSKYPSFDGVLDEEE